MKVMLFVLVASLVSLYPALLIADPVKWPPGIKTAVSLSYDDALESQLDHVIPALDKHGFKASFYLRLNAPTVSARLDEWRAAAKSGHELGNHTIYHPCSKSLPDRDWVMPYHDTDKRTVAQMEEEIVTANTFLQAIDGRRERTFTIPCGDMIANGENYLPAIEKYFVAIKGQGIATGIASLYTPADVSGETLINYVKQGAASGKLVNILFHGVGGDYLTVSTRAHDALLEFLAKNKDDYWVDSYINIMRFVNKPG